MAFASPCALRQVHSTALRCGPRYRTVPSSVLRYGTRAHLSAHDVDSNRVGSHRFALISDVHVFDSEGIWNEPVTALLGQRLFGLLNIVALRGPRAYSVPVLEAAVKDMCSEGVGHLVVAGDVSNLALDCEFALAARIFKRFGSSQQMTFCPGNHDTYNRSERHASSFRRHFDEYCVSDLEADAREDGFPFAQVRNGVLFIVLNTGLPNTARGEVGARQWKAAADMLRTEAGRTARANAYVTVLVMHHAAQNPRVRGLPRIRNVGHDTKDWQAVPAFCKEFAVDIVLHGHKHVPYRGRLDGAPCTLVYESGSGTLMTANNQRIARYTVFEYSDGGLLRTYARVWSPDDDTFQTLELPIPAPTATMQNR